MIEQGKWLQQRYGSSVFVPNTTEPQYFSPMAGRFQTKTSSNGRLTPSNLVPTTTSVPLFNNPAPASPSTANTGGESDQNYLGEH